MRLSPRGKHKLHAIPQSKDKTENESKVNFDIGVQHSTEVGHHTGDFIYGAVISGEDGASPFEDNAGGVNVTNRSAIIAEVAGIVDGATDPRDESDEGSNDVWGNEMHFDPPPPDGLPQTGVLEEVDIAKLDEHDHVAEAVLDVLQDYLSVEESADSKPVDRSDTGKKSHDEEDVLAVREMPFLVECANAFRPQVTFRSSKPPHKFYVPSKMKGAVIPFATELEARGWESSKSAKGCSYVFLAHEQAVPTYASLGTHLFSKIAKSSHFDGKKRGTFFGILQAYAKHLKCSLSQYEVLPPTYLLSSSSSCRSFLEAATKVNAAGDGWIVKSLSGTGESRGLSIVSSVKEVQAKFMHCGSHHSSRVQVLAQKYYANKIEVRAYMLIASTRPWLVFFMEGPVIVERSFHAHGESSRTVDFSSVGSLDDALRLVGGKKDAARLATKKMKDSAVFLFKSGRHAGLRRHPGTHLFVALDFIIPTFPAIGSPMLIDAEVAPQFRHYSLERRRNATTAMYDVIFGTNIKDSPGRIGGDSAGKPMLVSHDFRHCVGGECWHLAWSELEVKCSGASRPHGCTLL